MADRIHEVYHVGPTVGMAAGAAVSMMMLNGPWHLRVAAGAVGAAFSYVGTPIFAPLVQAGFVWVYDKVGVDPTTIPADAIPGMTGFLLGITGIDTCRFVIDSTKRMLALMRLPPKKDTP